MFRHIGFLFFISVLAVSPALAEPIVCSGQQRDCILEQLIETSSKIENPNWRDQSYREIAKTLAADGGFDQALGIWDKMENPDTKALTIRGIGMAVAGSGLEKTAADSIFQKLRDKSETISHPPSYAIALTYIAMAQAFAGDDEGAWATAADMENDALRHKAYGETAEVQAEKGNHEAAMMSISKIESLAYRNKSYSLVSKILADQGLYDEAVVAANPISNAYKKANALQYILDKQKPRDEIKTGQ